LKLLAQIQEIANTAGGLSRYHVRVATDALHLQDGAPRACDLVICAEGFFGYAWLAWRRSDSSSIAGTDAAHGYGFRRPS
jgi:hypothetical protein